MTSFEGPLHYFFYAYLLIRPVEYATWRVVPHVPPINDSSLILQFSIYSAPLDELDDADEDVWWLTSPEQVSRPWQLPLQFNVNKLLCHFALAVLNGYDDVIKIFRVDVGGNIESCVSVQFLR